jgi:hypothetical protein
MWMYLVIFGLMSLLYIGLGWPLARSRVGPNSWYGLRVGETMANETVWYEANAICGREFVGFGWGTLVLAVGLFFVPWGSPDLYATVLVVVHVVGVLVVAGRGMATARDIHARVTRKKK